MVDDDPVFQRTLRLASVAWPDSDPGQLKAAYLLRRHALQQLSDVLLSEHASVLVVKGASLAETHYSTPWMRPMADVDIIVSRSDVARISSALSHNGWVVQRTPGRELTQECLEIGIQSPGAFGSVLLELHLGLDKVVPREVDLGGLFSRATALPGLPALYSPEPEDQFLLVVLHLASDEFRHLTGFVDMELLLSSGIDLDKVVARARHWRAITPLHVALKTLEALLPGVASPDLLRRSKPGLSRSALVSTCFDVGQWPVVDSTELGWKWIGRQTVLRDDAFHWLTGVGLYGFRRALERSNTHMKELLARLVARRRA